MFSSGFGLWIVICSALAMGDATATTPPRALDSKLVFERIAAEPDIVTPTGIAVDQRGRVRVIESHTHFRPEGYQGPPADRVRIFEDRDRDGKPECTGSFVEGTRMTMSVTIAHDGSVFVATRSALYRFEDRDGNGRADGTDGGKLPAPIVRLDTRGDYPHNGLSGFAFDCDGTVYFGLGENLGADYRLKGSDGTTFSGGGEGGNIYRCQPDGCKLERVATGFWNPFHVAFNAFGQLFAVDNDPDSRPPCRLLHIVDGGDYGYRFRNGRKGLHPFTAWNGELPGTLGMVAGTGEAPSGVIAYEWNQLPEDYRGSLLVTSWGDHRIEQYRLEPRGASFRAIMKSVVAGGEDFRPVGIAAAPDGSLYISDWVDKSYTLHGQGRIWRLRSREATTHNQPSVLGLPRADDRARRRAAELKALGAANGPKTSPTASAFLTDKSADIRAFAIRLLPIERSDLKVVAVADPSPLVRASAMRRLADPGARELFLKALDSGDPFIQQAARLGLSRSLTVAELAAIANAQELTPARRLGVLLILRNSGQSEARRLLPRFLADPDPLVRFAAIQWVGEHRMEAFRPQLLAGLAASSVTRNEFEATLAALELLDRKPRAPTDEMAGEDYIAALLSKPGTPAPVQRRGLRMLRPALDMLTGVDSEISAAPTHGLSAEISVDGWLARLDGGGDAATGERVFFHSKGPGCSLCHQADGRGGRTGPELSTQAAASDRRRLVESIVAPSKEIAPQFVAWTVARTDGTVVTGVLLEESPEGALVLADSEGRQVTIKPDQVAERKPQTTSIMPAELVKKMTVQEFRDLVAFLSGQLPSSRFSE